jgi:hypothetical protein
MDPAGTLKRSDVAVTPSAPPALIFLHVPKTAGATLTVILVRHYPQEATFLIGGPGRPTLKDFEALPLHERARFTCLAGHVAFGVHRLLPGPARYITMLRDPVDRLVSLYYYVRETPEHPMHERLIRERVTLEEFVRSIPPDAQVRLVSGAPHRGPTTREMLERARQNLRERFVAFGLAERFDESLLLFARVLGWGNLYSRRQNVTRARPVRSTLASSTVAMIEEHNVLDRELYTFASEAFEPMLRADAVRAADVRRFKILNRSTASWWPPPTTRAGRERWRVTGAGVPR